MISPGREPAKGGLSGMGILRVKADRSPGPAPLYRVLGLSAIGHPLSLALELTWHTLADEWPLRNFKPQYWEHTRYLDGGGLEAFSIQTGLASLGRGWLLPYLFPESVGYMSPTLTFQLLCPGPGWGWRVGVVTGQWWREGGQSEASE